MVLCQLKEKIIIWKCTFLGNDFIIGFNEVYIEKNPILV